MGTPFTGLIEPRELKLEGYDRNLTHDKQPSHIPKTFIDSMKVREEVFVHEQKWPLKLEYDADDARSCQYARLSPLFSFMACLCFALSDLAFLLSTSLLLDPIIR